MFFYGVIIKRLSNGINISVMAIVIYTEWYMLESVFAIL